MSKGKKDPALKEEGFKRRLYCWMRQQRSAIAIHKTLYYERAEPMLHDLQFDYLEKRLDAVEKRHPDISKALRDEGYLSPGSYVDALRLPEIEYRADKVLENWKECGRPPVTHIPMITPEMDPNTLYREALTSIIGYPI
jgi:hypothetical protein